MTKPAKKCALLLVHRIPFPPDKGDKIRSWQLTQYLAQKYHLTLGGFVDEERDWRYVERLEKLCETVKFFPLHREKVKWKSLTGLLRGEALSQTFYRSKAMDKWLSTLCAKGPFDLVMGFSSSMGQYVTRKGLGRVRLLDMVDADSDKWRQYAKQKCFPESWLYHREAKRLQKDEALLSRQLDGVFLITPEEADYVRALSGADSAKIDYWRNGVDLDYFNPASVSVDEKEVEPDQTARCEIVFAGAMDYWANVQAIDWFMTKVWPRAKAQNPDLHLTIVGSNPTPKVRALATQDGVEVTGRVADVRPFLARASLIIAPLQIARGVQNKVLEAMAMAKPVIASPQALEGLEAEAHDCLYPATQAEDWVNLLGELTPAQRAEKGAAARLFVERHYGWRGQLARLGAHLDSFAVHGLDPEE